MSDPTERPTIEEYRWALKELRGGAEYLNRSGAWQKLSVAVDELAVAQTERAALRKRERALEDAASVALTWLKEIQDAQTIESVRAAAYVASDALRRALALDDRTKTDTRGGVSS